MTLGQRTAFLSWRYSRPPLIRYVKLVKKLAIQEIKCVTFIIYFVFFLCQDMRFASNCNTTYNFQVERKMIEVGHFSPPPSPPFPLFPSLSPSFNNYYNIVAAIWAENGRVWEAEERADFNVAETVEKTGKLLNHFSIVHNTCMPIPTWHSYSVMYPGLPWHFQCLGRPEYNEAEY